SSAKSCERMVAVSASRTIQTAAPSSSFHFHPCNPQTRRSLAGALQEREHERRPRRATEHSVLLKTDDIERDCGASGAAVADRRRLKPSPLTGTRRFREEKRRAIRLNRHHRRRYRREGDPFASRPPFCWSPHSWSRSLRYTYRCGR